MKTVTTRPVDFKAASSTDLWVEQLAEQHDPFAGPPESWPRFMDEERWTLWVIEPEPEPTPAQEDEDEDEDFEPSQQDWQEYGVHCDRMAALEDLLQEDRRAALEILRAGDRLDQAA